MDGDVDVAVLVKLVLGQGTEQNSGVYLGLVPEIFDQHCCDILFFANFRHALNIVFSRKVW